MFSRLLPWSRTLDVAQPPSVTRRAGDGFVAYAAPACPDDSLLHRWVLDEPPASMAPWLQQWRAAQPAGVEQALFVWEGRKHQAPDDAEQVVPIRCLMADQELLPPVGFAAERLGVESVDDVVALLRAPHGDSEAYGRWARWTAGQQLGRDDAAFYGVRADGRLVAMAGVVWDRREARLQLVHTLEGHRRQGLGAGLVQRVVHHYQELSFGITYAAAQAGSEAEQMLRGLGFRGTTAVTLVVAQP